jgi:hypothetical protein
MLTQFAGGGRIRMKADNQCLLLRVISPLIPPFGGQKTPNRNSNYEKNGSDPFSCLSFLSLFDRTKNERQNAVDNV